MMLRPEVRYHILGREQRRMDTADDVQYTRFFGLIYSTSSVSV